jgi:hypothetical protein
VHALDLSGAVETILDGTPCATRPGRQAPKR